MTSSGSVDVSVVIPAYNAEATLGETLEGLCDQSTTASWEVVVVDNASTDRTADVAGGFTTRLPGMRIVSAAKRGVSHARNVGAAHAIGRSIVWLDADDVPSPGWLDGVAVALEHHALIGSSHDNRTLNQQTESARSCDDTREPLRLWYPPHVAHVGGCGLGVRRDVWERLGGFDEGLPVLEDTDFCIRAHQAGVEIHMADAWIQVRFRRALRETFLQARSWSATNVLLYKRYRPSGARLPQAWRDYGRSWTKAPRLVRRSRDERQRQRLAWLLGWQIGMFQGCVRHRVPPIPLPGASRQPSGSNGRRA